MLEKNYHQSNPKKDTPIHFGDSMVLGIVKRILGSDLGVWMLREVNASGDKRGVGWLKGREGAPRS